MESKGMTADGAGEAAAGANDNGFPVPVPARSREYGNGKWEVLRGWAVLSRRSSAGEAISVVRFDDAAGVGEHGEPLIERGGADATAGTHRRTAAPCRQRRVWL